MTHRGIYTKRLLENCFPSLDVRTRIHADFGSYRLCLNWLIFLQLDWSIIFHFLSGFWSLVFLKIIFVAGVTESSIPPLEKWLKNLSTHRSTIVRFHTNIGRIEQQRLLWHRPHSTFGIGRFRRYSCERSAFYIWWGEFISPSFSSNLKLKSHFTWIWCINISTLPRSPTDSLLTGRDLIFGDYPVSCRQMMIPANFHDG